jgi:predicted enzyme related to lactoylglutathione lyase
MKPNIVWYDIPAHDIDRAIQFYSAVLALPVKKELVGDVPTGWLPTDDGQVMGCVCVVPGFKPSADGVMIYLDVNGRLRNAVAAVRNHGGNVQSDIHSIGQYGFRAEVLDSEGNCIALHSETDA